MCYQAVFAWQRQSKQETLRHMTFKMESIKWGVQLLKTNFTFIRSGYLCSWHEVCQPHFSLTKFSAAAGILMNQHCNMYERWHWDEFMKSQVPEKYKKLLVGSNTNLVHLKCPFQRSSSFCNLFAHLCTDFHHIYPLEKPKKLFIIKKFSELLIRWGQSQGQSDFKSSSGHIQASFHVKMKELE